MRIIATIDNQAHAKSFSNFLRSQGIENTCEMTYDKEKGSMMCSIWIHEEDDVNEALKLFEAFQKDPQNEQYKKNEPAKKKAFSAIENPRPKMRVKQEKPKFMFVTYFFLSLCVAIFFINLMQEMQISKERGGAMVLVTPIQYALLYDAPPYLEKIDELFAKHKIQKGTKAEEITKDAEFEFQVLSQMPAYRGFYSWIIQSISGKAIGPSGPMFIKIKQGEVWRLFTPTILHKDFLHIVFNMLWLWVLGKQIEARVPKVRLFLMILIIGILSNTAQYLMSGPYFLGFSGVILGMAGFIWMRQRLAPWEGYPLNKGTLLFLAFFVIAMIGLQAVSFFMQISGKEFMFNIANSAHVVGGVTGALLGRLSFFSWRAS